MGEYRGSIHLSRDWDEGFSLPSTDDLGFFIYCQETGLSEQLARDNWTAKHFQNKQKNNSYQLAEKIINFIKENTD